MMTLAPGKSSGEKAEAHEDSDQVLLTLEGELIGEAGDEHLSLKKGDVIMIPSGVKRRFTNRLRKRAVTFQRLIASGLFCWPNGVICGGE